jgi:putative heme-binding domain-containing protein
LPAWTGPKVEELEPAEAVRQAAALAGDAERGRQVFAALSCANCHDVAPTDELRGPYLPNVAKTYQRAQLVEAILMPSKSIAQGFVQNIFVLDDGRVVAGFVTNEAPAEVTVRDNQGRPIRIPVESIVERSESPLSVMPEGQVNQLPVAALADLVTYLQSLGTP